MDKESQDIKRLVLYPLIGLFVIFLDQFTKWLAVCSRGGFFVIPKLLKIEIYRNKGIAFGLSIPYLILYILVAVVLAVCFWQIRQGLVKKNFLMVLTLILVVAGAISNLIDRVHLGYIVDILHFVPTGSMFNLADVAILVGVGMLVWKNVKCKTKNAK